MQGLSFTFSAATLFLVLCLQLGIIESQDDENVRKPLLMELDVPRTAQQNEQITVQLTVETQYRECMVVKAYLVSNEPMEGAFNYVQTRCLCNDHPIKFFWDMEIKKTVTFATVIDIVQEKNICPNDMAVVPITGNRYYAYNIVRMT
ncbi:prolactin-inducible protein homolog [Mus caroli]|uniref:Prolactin-inducible protein homolog n=1 Tax=Mus caroli TaxID=10089 RepID=A0A6P5PSL9_MUSCR|nr:prolactin-inducible protein homolog [Mus caroli]